MIKSQAGIPTGQLEVFDKQFYRALTPNDLPLRLGKRLQFQQVEKKKTKSIDIYKNMIVSFLTPKDSNLLVKIVREDSKWKNSTCATDDRFE